MSPEELRRLFKEASTPEEAAMVLCARGRPGLGVLVRSLRATDARGAAADFRRWAALPTVGTGWFEKGEARTEQASKAIRSAFLWCAEVFDRYAPKQLPIVIDNNSIDDVARETRSSSKKACGRRSGHRDQRRRAPRGS